MSLIIRKAQRSKAWVKLVIDGVSGAGKTYSSLQIARGLGERPILIDTENGSGELYSHLYEYDYIRLNPPFTPAKYVEAIDAAIKNGNDVIVIDSLTHCWKYILSYKESLDAANPKAGFTNWAKAKLLFDECKTALLQCPGHVIATLRAGSEYAESFDVKGNKKFDKVGTKPLAEPDLEYEFTLALRIERSHLATATKDRTERFDIAAPFTPSPNTGRILRDWLNEGVGELPGVQTWANNTLTSDDAKRALNEAERLGVGDDGRTNEDLEFAARELVNQKRAAANAKIKALGLDTDNQGLKTFSSTAKAAGLDPLEVFGELISKRTGLKTWVEFQTVLTEYITAADLPVDLGNLPTTNASPSNAGPSANKGVEKSKSTADEKPKRADSAASSQQSTNSNGGADGIKRLAAAVRVHNQGAALINRIDLIGYELFDFCTEVIEEKPEAKIEDLIEILVEKEGRGR